MNNKTLTCEFNKTLIVGLFFSNDVHTTDRIVIKNIWPKFFFLEQHFMTQLTLDRNTQPSQSVVVCQSVCVYIQTQKTDTHTVASTKGPSEITQKKNVINQQGTRVEAAVLSRCVVLALLYLCVGFPHIHLLLTSVTTPWLSHNQHHLTWGFILGGRGA